MPGINCNQFVDLTESEKNVLSCGICQQILDNPLTTDCGHNFCQQCIEDCIKNKQKGCPECKIKFKKLRYNGNEDNKDFVVISRYGYIFTRNTDLKSMVDKLNIKCKFESNGCKEVIELGLLSSHMKVCKARSGKVYEIKKNKMKPTFVRPTLLSEQKIETMAKDMVELKSKLKRREYIIPGFTNNLKFDTFDVNYVLFGTHSTDLTEIRLYDNNICFCNSGIHFMNIKKVMYCSDSDLPLLIIDIKDCGVAKSLCSYIRERNQITDLTNGWFDIYSIDISERYIIIELFSNENIDIFIKLLSIRLSEYNLNNYCESIDDKKAKSMVTRARVLQAIDFHIHYLLFGTHLKDVKGMSLYVNKISVNKLDIPFKNIEQFMYCIHPSLPILIIKVDNNLYKLILKRIQTSNSRKGCFDVNSKDSSERYIIIELTSNESIEIFIKSFTLRLSKSKELQLNCRPIDESNAKQMVTTARRLQK